MCVFQSGVARRRSLHLHSCTLRHEQIFCFVVDDIHRSIMSCEEIRAKINGTEDSDKAFQEGYNVNLSKLHSAVKNGEIVMPTREELGDWLRQSPWIIMV